MPHPHPSFVTSLPLRRTLRSPLSTAILPSAPSHPVTPLRAARPRTLIRQCVQRAAPDRAAAAHDLLAHIEEIAGPDRGIFGMLQENRDLLEGAIRAAEAQNPTPVPTADNARAAAGTWRLLYTTLTILGSRRVRLAIRSPSKPGLVTLGELLQIVDPSSGCSRSIVHFDIIGRKTGTFTISADYTPVSDTRVEVVTTASALEPESMEQLLGDNRQLLVDIFNPQGYLDITYVDESMRIGRDNKGKVFVLEKVTDEVQ